MMQSGPSINPVTRKPRSLRAEHGPERDAMERQKLQKQAERMTIQDDPVVDVLLQRIYRRIDQLITDDPEAQAYVSLLNDLGREFNLAKRAARLLAARAGFGETV